MNRERDREINREREREKERGRVWNRRVCSGKVLLRCAVAMFNSDVACVCVCVYVCVCVCLCL